MRLRLFYDKSVHENAAYYYELAKASRQKAEGVKKAIEETEKEIREAAAGKDGKGGVRVKRQKEWYEKFHFSFTTGGLLMIGGRSAQQNDMLVSRYMEDGDIFVHADIQGGSVVILKGGAAAMGRGARAPNQGETPGGEESGPGEKALREAAQFAASMSKAWVNANASVDVYAVRKSQLGKHAQGGFVPTGAFAITGDRLWFRGTKLELRIGLGEKGIELVPAISGLPLKDPLLLVPSKSGKEKGALAKSLAKRFGVHPDELLEILPNGRSKTVETK